MELFGQPEKNRYFLVTVQRASIVLQSIKNLINFNAFLIVEQ